MCKILAIDAEYPSDKHLLYIVQLQRISERISQVSAQNGPGNCNPGFSFEQDYRNLKSDLELYRANLPFLLTESRE